MKRLMHTNEGGQALIIIAFAAVALFAFAALAIDSSIVFSDRRHAQNAADTAAMAGIVADRLVEMLAVRAGAGNEGGTR